MEPALGWRLDPFATHELRYYFDGEPTSWVCTAGKISLETVAPAHDLVDVAVDPPESDPPPAVAVRGPVLDWTAGGWQRDPVGSHEFRYFDGSEPTTWVSTSGTISEELPVTVDGLLRSFTEKDAVEATGRDNVPAEPMAALVAEESLANFHRSVDLAASGPAAPPHTETLHAWSIEDGDPWARDAPEPRETTYDDAFTAATLPPPQPVEDRRGRRTRRAVFLVCAAAALALATSLAAVAATGGQSKRPRPSTSSTAVTAPAVRNPTAAWWRDTGQPDSVLLLADVQTMSGLTADPNGMTSSCHTLSTDVATATSAPRAPTAAVEREWRRTVSAVTRIINACATGSDARVAALLPPATQALDNLSAQVSGYLR